MRDRQDKIFDNTFDSAEFELDQNISFDLDPQWVDSRPEEDKMQQRILQERLHDLITTSRFKEFNDLDEFANAKKLRKADINEIYEFILDEMVRDFTRIEIFSELCDYFNVHPTKFYTSLSNVFKEGLIEELDSRTDILKRKNINRLF